VFVITTPPLPSTADAGKVHISIEGGTEHTTSTVPGDTPKGNDRFVGIKGVFKF
jgi:hypothetical protein